MAALSFTHLILTKTLPSSSTNNLRRPSPHPHSATMTMAKVSSKPSYWASMKAEIAANLEIVLAKREPLVVRKPMHDLVFAAPETMAPALCIAACEAVGGRRTDEVVAAATAINLVHAAACTRQRLPNLLEKKTLDANVELLMGECISALGFEVLASSKDESRGGSERILTVIVELARAGGAEGLVGGLHEELRWGREGKEGGGLEKMKEACRRKEGELCGCGAACGAILGGTSEEEIEKLRRFG